MTDTENSDHWSHDKDILGLVDSLCHITWNPNPNWEDDNGRF